MNLSNLTMEVHVAMHVCTHACPISLLHVPLLALFRQNDNVMHALHHPPLQYKHTPVHPPIHGSVRQSVFSLPRMFLNECGLVCFFCINPLQSYLPFDPNTASLELN